MCICICVFVRIEMFFFAFVCMCARERHKGRERYHDKRIVGFEKVKPLKFILVGANMGV